MEKTMKMTKNNAEKLGIQVADAIVEADLHEEIKHFMKENDCVDYGKFYDKIYNAAAKDIMKQLCATDYVVISRKKLATVANFMDDAGYIYDNVEVDETSDKLYYDAWEIVKDAGNQEVSIIE